MGSNVGPFNVFVATLLVYVAILQSPSLALALALSWLCRNIFSMFFLLIYCRDIGF